MSSFVPYINSAMTLAEAAFNTCGYFPKDTFPTLNAESTKWRFRFGLLQAISGFALTAIGIIADSMRQRPHPQKYLSFPQQMASLGRLYINHGTFNIIRSYIEAQGLGMLTLSYDFYGRKFLPALSEPFDVQSRFFHSIHSELDRIQMITIFPLEISLRSK